MNPKFYNVIEDLLDVEEFEFYIRFKRNEYVKSDIPYSKEEYDRFRLHHNNQNGYYTFTGNLHEISHIMKIGTHDIIIYEMVK